MIVDSERTIALICPACQEIQKHHFSLFRIARQHLNLLCCCGFSSGSLRDLHGNVEIDVLSMDGERTNLVLSRSKLIRTNLIEIVSPEKRMKLGCVGTLQAVEEYLANDRLQFLPETGDFSDPFIMRKTLKVLQELAKRHKIRCECERPSIGIDVYSKQVELVCASCESMVRISANTKKDLERLSQIEEIVIQSLSSRVLQRL